MNGTKQLERAALDAHRRGESWQQFMQTHHDSMRACESSDVQRYRALCGRLLHCLATGERSGMEPPNVESPWERNDNVVTPADTGTKANIFNGPLASIFSR